MTGSVSDLVVRQDSPPPRPQLQLLRHLHHHSYHRIQRFLLPVHAMAGNRTSSRLCCNHQSLRPPWAEIRGSPHHSSHLHCHRRSNRLSTAFLTSTLRARSNEVRTRPGTTAPSVVEVIEGKNGEAMSAISPHTTRPNSTSMVAWKRMIRTMRDAVVAAARGDGENVSCSPLHSPS